VIKKNDSPQTAEYFKSLANVWKQNRRQSFAEFLELNYRLSENEGIAPQAFNLRDNPYWREPIDNCNNGRTNRISILKSTQVGGTITAQGILMAAAAINPAPAMAVFPDHSEAKLQRDRIVANMLESRPRIRNLAPLRTNARSIDMQTQQVFLGNAGSDQSLRGKPCRFVIKHEVDVYPRKANDKAGNPQETPDERTKTFTSPLIFEESTPAGNDSYIAAQFEASQKRFWFVQCPKCKRWQKTRFFPYAEGKFKGRGGIVGYKDAAGNLRSIEEARRLSYYLCVHGCKITPQYKNDMIAGGRWVPSGCSIDDDTGETTGTPYRSDRHIGYHIWTIMQSKKSIGDIVEAYITFSRKGNLRGFFQDWLGIKYERNLKLPTWEKLGTKYKTGHKLKQVPNDCWFLTLGADVQEHETFWVVWGWSPGRTPALIDLGVFDQEAEEKPFVVIDGQMLSSDIAQLLDKVNIKKTQYPVLPHEGKQTNPIGLSSLAIKIGGTDTNYRNHEVHAVVKKMRHPTDPNKDRLRSTRGDRHVDPDTRYKMSLVEKSSRDGKPYPGGLRLWNLCKGFYRDIWETRLVLPPGETQAMRLPDDLLESPHGERFLKQLLNERNQESFNARTNEKKDHPRIIDKTLRCDFRDASIIAEAVADMATDLIFGQVEWMATEWAKKVQHQHQPATPNAEPGPVDQSPPATDRPSDHHPPDDIVAR